MGNGRSKKVRLVVEVTARGRETENGAARDLTQMIDECIHTDDHWKDVFIKVRVKEFSRVMRARPPTRSA